MRLAVDVRAAVPSISITIPDWDYWQTISKKIIPAFFKLLQAQEQDKQDAARKELLENLNDFGSRVKGPFR